MCIIITVCEVDSNRCNKMTCFVTTNIAFTNDLPLWTLYGKSLEIKIVTCLDIDIGTI